LGSSAWPKRTSGPAPQSRPLVLRSLQRNSPRPFAGGRYDVRRFLGEGGKKRVYLAHDTRLDRDVALALIRAEGLDDVGGERITREAQAMGRLGAHPRVVTIFEIGDEGGAPYVVTELRGSARCRTPLGGGHA
jgi:serine/threonine protein kinase